MRPLAIALTALSLLASGSAHAARYTLKQLLERVGREYPGVLAAEAGVHVARAQLAQAQRSWLPGGDLTFWITGSPEVKCADATGFSSPDKRTREANCVQTGVVDYLRNDNLTDVLPVHGVLLNFSLTLTQPLYTFGKIESALGAAGVGVSAARDKVEQARSEALFNAARAFFGVKAGRASKATLDEGVSKLEEWVGRITQDLEGENKSHYTEGDLARIKIALEYARLQQLDVERGLRLAESGLRVLSGDPQAEVDEDELELPELLPQPMAWWEEMARTHRPEARLLDASVAAAEWMRKWKRSEMLPDLALRTAFNAGYSNSIDTAQNAFMSHPNTVGLNLVLAVKQSLDFGVSYGRYQQAAAEAQAAAERRRQALGGLQIEIDKAWLDYDEARRRAERSGHGERVARGWYNAVDQTMKAGLVSDPRELTEAARSYFELRLRHLQAMFDTNVQLAWLRRTTGVE